jgi:formate dehydrogenase subunit gamma
MNGARRLVLGALAALTIGLPAVVGAYEQPFVPNPPTKPDQQQVERQKDQPLNNAPIWRDVRSGEINITQQRGVDTGILIQPAGETWRAIRNGPVTLYGGILLIAVPVIIGLFYAWKGPIKVQGQLTGRLILRFTPWDRIIHWSVALSWLLLALSGLTMLFGKHVLLPLIGYTLFSWLAIAGKNLHNFVGPLFLASAVAMFFTYLSRNLPRAGDAGWFAKGGGLLSGEHVPSGFFNAGEKIVFWVGLTLFGLVASLSGLVLNFPNFEQGRAIMQQAHLFHSITAIVFMALMMGHIYLGTVGFQGVYEGMRRDGLVDETWAKEHHENWYNDVKAGKASHGTLAGPAGRSGTIPQSSHALREEGSG